MHFFKHLYILVLSFTTTLVSARKSPQSLLLSDIKALTLRKDLKTSHNRVPALPQLKCIGGTAKGLYEIDVLRCKNAGSSYGDEDVQWTCTASLPSEFKLGSTDVICEGFSSPEDPYVLKGSCGVEYRLMLTRLGEEKFGRNGKDIWSDYNGRSKGDWAATAFWFIFIAVLGWILYAALIRDSPGRRPPGAAPNNWFGGGGGGDNDDPPPPYEYRSSPKTKATSSRAPRAAAAQAQRGWRPGFWSGALGGAAAGYMVGNRGQSQRPRDQSAWNFNGVNGRGSGEATSSFAGAIAGRARSSEGSRSISSYGSNRHESSGFGGTSRR